MNKKAVRAGVACGILLGTTIIAYAITSLFFTKSETSKLSKKTVFQFDLEKRLNYSYFISFFYSFLYHYKSILILINIY